MVKSSSQIVRDYTVGGHRGSSLFDGVAKRRRHRLTREERRRLSLSGRYWMWADHTGRAAVFSGCKWLIKHVRVDRETLPSRRTRFSFEKAVALGRKRFKGVGHSNVFYTMPMRLA